MKLIIDAKYEHVKTGKLYRLLSVAKHHQNLEEYVVYEALYDNQVSKIWMRTKEEFLGEAKSSDGSFHPRYTLVED